MNTLKTILAASAIGLVAPLQAQEQITNLPTFYIATEDPHVQLDKENYQPGTVTIVTDIEEDAITDVAMGIRGRGNSTWNFPKKPYRIKFDKKINLFNLPAKAKSWVLLANHADKTLIRNAVALEVSRLMDMEFTASTVFADVVFNGEYLGNYMITDQMQINQGRVEIDEMEPTDTEDENLTGGYFLEIDGFAYYEPVWFQTEKGLQITVKSPDEETIQPVQLEYITNFVQEFEDRLFSDNFTDPELGYRAMVDEKSLIAWYICCEVTANPDSFWSTYIYKKRSEDRLYFGPMWDFDIAFNNDYRAGDTSRKLMRDEAFNPKTWIQRLWQDPWFRQETWRRWAEVVETKGVKQHLLSYIDQLAEQLDASQKKNFQRWPVLNKQVYNELRLFKTYNEGVQFLRDYVDSRIDFITESFALTGKVTETFTFWENRDYKICHSSGNYITLVGDDVKIMAESDAPQQLIRFVAANPSEAIYNLQVADGSYIGSDNHWDTRLMNDPTDALAQYSVENSSYPGYYAIKNIGKDRYLGTDGNNSGDEIYTDKKGEDLRHAWTIIPAEPDGDPAALQQAIDQALALLSEAIAGEEPGQYPRESFDTLNAELTRAQSTLTSCWSQADFDSAADALIQAIEAFKDSIIVSGLNIPDAAPSIVITLDGDCLRLAGPIQGHTLSIYSPSGALLLRLPASPAVSLAVLPSGLYIARLSTASLLFRLP